MPTCIKPDLLISYAKGTCTTDERRDVEIHLGQCDECKLQIERARKTETYLEPPEIETENQTDNKEDIETTLEDRPTAEMPEITGFIPETDIPVSSGSLESSIEGYQILGKISTGGQAVVYEAIQKATNRKVALKVLLHGAHASERARYRFEREVDLAANLHHPNIVTIYDSGITEGLYYFAMEYIAGRLLDNYIRAENLSLKKIMFLFNKVCAAVAYAHQHGVMHRDLKPGNILVDEHGEPHILDFGLAKLKDGSEQTAARSGKTSLTGQIMGTLAYMSPEQAAGDTSSIDVRTDVYSIGVILYKSLTGHYPYDVDGPMLEILRNIQQVEPIRPSRIVRQINSEVEAILLKAMDKNPDRRYQSAAELQSDIDSWLQGMPIVARSNSSIYLVRKLITRHYFTSTVIFLLLIIIFGFSGFSFSVYRTYSGLDINHSQLQQDFSNQGKEFNDLKHSVTFLDFLQGWRIDLVSEGIGYFPKDSREMQAINFLLLDRRPLIEKESKYRAKWENREPFFTQFIIAEHYFKDGGHQQARQAYQRCLSIKTENATDAWLIKQTRLQLRNLERLEKSDKTASEKSKGDIL